MLKGPFINQAEFREKIKNYILSEDMEKAFKGTIFFNKAYSEDCFRAMMHGMIWATLLTSQCDKFYLPNSIEIY